MVKRRYFRYMLIYVCDFSKGIAFRKNKRRLASILFRISNRSFIGDLPYWVVKDLLNDLKKDATKASKTIVFVESKRKNGPGFLGWKAFSIGNSQNFEKYTHFLEAKSFIDLNT